MRDIESSSGSWIRRGDYILRIFYKLFNDNNVVSRKEKNMQIYDEKAYNWNRGVAPEGNMAGVHPRKVADLCDKNTVYNIVESLNQH